MALINVRVDFGFFCDIRTTIVTLKFSFLVSENILDGLSIIRVIVDTWIGQCIMSVDLAVCYLAFL